jgi:Tol biopolymer transport system component
MTLTPKDFRSRLHTTLDAIEVPDQPWEPERPPRRGYPRATRIVTVLGAAATVALIAAELVSTHFGEHSTGGTSPGVTSPGVAAGDAVSGLSVVNQPLRTAPVRGATVSASMARQPGFLVYLGGKNLLGPVVSSDEIEGGNANWNAARNSAGIVASPAGQAYWSPAINSARTKVVFVEGLATQIGRFNGVGNLAIANVDGSDPVTVTNDGADTDPTWSPNGREIAFLRYGAVWLMNADGTHQHSLGVGLDVYSLAWSPNGKQLAVDSGDAPVRIAIITIQNSTFRWFGSPRAEEYDPSWSPNGKELVYGETGPNALFISDVDGTDTHQVTSCRLPACTQDVEPAWSPDGSEIAFVRSDDGVQQIALVSAAGGKVRVVTSGPQQHNLPSW